MEVPDESGAMVGLPLKSPAGLIRSLAVNVRRNGGLLLNISPKADDTIPDGQQQVLLAMGKWLGVNDDAIYGTRPWKISEEGRVHFTTEGQALYAISMDWPKSELVIPALKSAQGKVTKVELLGHERPGAQMISIIRIGKAVMNDSAVQFGSQPADMKAANLEPRENRLASCPCENPGWSERGRFCERRTMRGERRV